MDARIGIEGNGPTKGKPVKMDLFLTGNDALAVDIVATNVMMLDWKKTYLKYVADKAHFKGDTIPIEGLPVEAVARRFEPPNIDLPVKLQMKIYQHQYATKFMFCSLDIIHLFQRVTKMYRREPMQLV
jgi:uncharacterized protein (DUF362 family)